MRPAERVKEQTRDLWRRVFGDPEDFIALYFSERYTQQVNVYREVEGRVVSALQVLPYDVCYQGMRLQSGYLSGIATDPAYRGMGFAASIIREAHLKIYRDGGALAFLIPASESLFSYYERFGYGTFGARQDAVINVMSLSRSQNFEVERVGQLDSELAQYIEDQLAKKRNAVLHGVTDLGVVLRDFNLANAPVYAALANGKPVGVLFGVVDREQRRAAVMELLCDSEMVSSALLRRFSQDTDCEHLSVRKPVPFTEIRAVPYVQIRVLRVFEMLSAFAKAHPHEERVVTIEKDDLIPQNAGTYLLSKGVCQQIPKSESEQSLSLTELSSFLAPEKGFHVSLMLD